MTQAIPNEYPGLIPYLSIQGAAQALDFYRRAFGAEVAYRINGLEGRLGHAELRVGKACFMLADPCEANSQMASAPEHSSAISLYLYVEDVDTCFAQALAAGAEQLMEPQDMFYGDRSGMLRDPYGFVWNLASHVEDVSPRGAGTPRRADVRPAAGGHALSGPVGPALRRPAELRARPQRRPHRRRPGLTRPYRDVASPDAEDENL